MAILKIARMGHPVLRRQAEEITDPTAPEIRQLIADMTETLADADGAGLAAPQVHVSKRLVIFSVPEDGVSEVEDDRPSVLQVLINPVIEPLDDKTMLGWEACLSVPDMIGTVERFRSIRYRGLGPEGETIDRTVEGFHARVVQHECDHLDGILYPMRITDLSLFGFTEEMNRALAEAEKAEQAAE